MVQVDPKKARKYFEEKMEFTIGPVELNGMMNRQEPINIIDVRTIEDFVKGHIAKAVNLPKDRWGTHAGLSKDKVNVLYCYTQVCHLAAGAAVEFSKHGYPVMELEGGFETWKNYNLPVET